MLIPFLLLSSEFISSNLIIKLSVLDIKYLSSSANVSKQLYSWYTLTLKMTRYQLIGAFLGFQGLFLSDVGLNCDGGDDDDSVI